MNWRASTLVIVAAIYPAVCSAQSAIGSAASVKNEVEGVLGGQTSRVMSGSSVRSNELIRSGDEAVANLVLLDQTKLSVGPRSEVRLDKFVYNPDQQNGAVVIQVSRGAYRFVTGVQDSKNYQIKTPYATLGVRGTILELNLEAYRAQARAGAGADMPVYKAPAGPCQSNVKVRLVEGAFQAQTVSGRTVSVNEPDKLLTVCSDGSFQVTPMSQSILNFQPEFAAVPSPALAALAVAAAVAVGVVVIKDKDKDPVSPN